VPQGVSRSTFYVQRTRELENKVGELEKFISSLQSGTDEAATSILAQLRIGLPAQDILRGVESSEQLPSSHSPPAGAESHLSLQPAHNSHGAQPPYSARRPEEFHFPIFDRSGWRSLEVVSDHHNTKALPEEGETDSLLNAPMKDPNRGGVEPSSGSVDSAGRVSLQTSASRQLAQMQRRPGNSAYIDSTRFENNFITASPNLANNFGNLSFSNSVLSNHYPQNIQSQQVGNLFLQRWAMLTPTQEYASGMPNSTPNTWGSIREESQEALMNGAVLDDICGQHPYMKALLDNNSFMSSPKLSQWAAQSVYSIKRSSQPGMTEFVSMYTFWLVMRWMIQPSPQTFKAIPTWLRPTPTQLFTPHSLAWDFLVWPAFRSLLSERPDLGFVNLSWALEMSLTIAFNWPGTVEEGLCRNPLTGELDLSPDAKVVIKRNRASDMRANCEYRNCTKI